MNGYLKKGDKKKKKKEGRPSTAKYLEIWHQLWNQWHNLVIEVGDEEGRYAYQDVHWEPPCFDCGSLADDLDEVAEKMLPLLDTIHNTGEEDLEIFAGAIDEIEDNIKSYPEWMCDFDHEEIYVGPVFTRCLLTWEKLHADSAASFADRLADLEAGWRCLLDTKAFIDFLDDFSSEQKQEIYEFITENRGRSFWQERLASPWSGWHHVYHALAKCFNQDTYLKDCGKLLARDWHYGLPVIEDRLMKGDRAGAEEIIKQVFKSYLGRRGQKSWDPEKVLLINRLCYGYGNADTELCSVFDHWLDIAGKEEKHVLKAALAFQLAVYHDPHAWDRIAALVRDFSASPAEQVIRGLCRQWMEYTVTVTLGLGFGRLSNTTPDWLFFLLKTGINQENREYFHDRVGNWLHSLGSSLKPREILADNYQVKSYCLLTDDILQIAGAAGRYANLRQAVNSLVYGGGKNKKIRHAWLRKFKAEELLDDILSAWQHDIDKFIPAPESAEKSNYDVHALWLAAVHDIDRDFFNRILSNWKTEHKRRRNLWKAVRQKGLPT
ncbi:MAG: hypothetical protein L3J03_03480 [Desulfobacterales bacterium]|nr:hypothetical protein [Desulfobacterales bacterium]